ncbi:MAG: hypothetical protein NTY39_11440 [Campylobacterales bacterium]|nr:hypothetical protein [Campylobacterales bacterium]
MIHIEFSQQHLDVFLSKIMRQLEQIVAVKLSKLNKSEEKLLLKFIQDELGLEALLCATPNFFKYHGKETFDELIKKIDAKIEQLKLGITREITEVDCGSYLSTLMHNELDYILNDLKIPFKTKITLKNKINKIRYVELTKIQKIEFSKKYFIIRSQEIFSIFITFYNEQWDKLPEYDRYIFVSDLNLKSCPYCNMNYIFIVEDKNLRPEIDHFYPKSKYPYFAMSYFNLIPSCPVCNKGKGNKFNDDLVNPYSNVDEDKRIDFTINLEHIDFMNIKKEKYNFDSFSIDIRKTKNGNVELLGLRELYRQHKDIVIDLLIKHQYYPVQYIYSLRAFNFSEEEIYRYLFNNYNKDKDLHKRPLAKLMRDIAKELKLIKSV